MSRHAGEDHRVLTVNPECHGERRLERQTALTRGEQMTTAQFEELCVDEAAEVRAWRFDALCRSGYESDAAVLLAANVDVDLHDAVDLVQRGCPPELAARILL
jgi:hypothetical protein